MAKNKNKISVTDFFQKDYIQFVQYVVEQRALPSIIDGLKPSYRKSMNSILSMKKGQVVNGLELVGETYKNASYHHGNAALEDVIVRHSSGFSNNSAPLVAKGSAGDIKSTTASAIRYLKFIQSDKTNLFTEDLDILKYNYDGDKKIEPKFYLPLIPLVLSSRSSGMAIGFAFSNNMSFSLESLTKSTIASLKNIVTEKNTKLPKLNPEVLGYNGKFEEVENGKYKTFGEYTIKGNTVTVTGFPIDQTFDSFEKNLVTLLEKKMKIINYANLSKKGVIKFTIRFNTTTLTNLKKNNCEPLEKLLKLTGVSNKNTFTFLDERGVVKDDLQTTDGIINYFTMYRLSRYQDRKNNLDKKMTANIDDKTDLTRFIKAVIDGKLEMRNRPIKEIKAFLTKEKIGHKVLDVKVTKITKEEYAKLLKEIVSLKKERTTMLETPTDKMYMSDLKQLLKTF